MSKGPNSEANEEHILQRRQSTHYGAVPREIVQKINKDVTELLRSPETAAKLKAQFVVPVTDTPEQFDEIIRNETAHMTDVLKEAGIGN